MPDTVPELFPPVPNASDTPSGIGGIDSGTVQPTAMIDENFPPRPTWKPNVPVDIERTVEALIYDTDGEAQFAVFEHGTCIITPSGAIDVESDAKKVLDKVYHHHPDFNPLGRDDGNYMIAYSQDGAVSIVFADEFEENREYIDRHHQDGVVRDEVPIPSYS